MPSQRHMQIVSEKDALLDDAVGDVNGAAKHLLDLQLLQNSLEIAARTRAVLGRRCHLRCLTLPCITKAARGGTELNRSETRRGFHASLGRGNPCTLVSGLACGLRVMRRRRPVRRMPVFSSTTSGRTSRPVSLSTRITGGPFSPHIQSLPHRHIAASTSQNAFPLSVSRYSKRGGCSSYETFFSRPSSTNRSSRRASTARGTFSARWKSSKRRRPENASRI